ncbi:hypothetical protein [Sanguibacter antarcticus]|uniref:Tight adherence protein B n=1 Tax=Sanguibacter antarcticus TaxID=372484 RepID=A0A2A9EAB4_9MICO|nr:hypothetical protein [Sanguibacter antarcticus]PFG35160.1 tight adherence protein B [Sanguibacter antarcticus]
MSPHGMGTALETVSAGSVLVGALVGIAVLVGAGPVGRPVAGVAAQAAPHRRPGTVTALVAALGRRLPFVAARGGQTTSMAMVVTQVAGLLRSGLAPNRAWPMVGGVRADLHGIPDAADLAALVGGTDDEQAARQAAAVVAACRLAAVVGASLAPVLESVVATLTAAAEAESERSAALAGPQTTARVLLWLPLVGAALGTALGADLPGLLLGGGVGAVVLVAGTALLLVGRTWTRRLVAGARRAGSPS